MTEHQVEPVLEMDQNTGILEKTVPDEKQIMLWIASKQLHDQEQSVNPL
jgi:hypothetical protein